MTTPKENFYPLATHPNCTHRTVISYQTVDTHEPMAFWACKECKRRFEPTQPKVPAYATTSPTITFNPVPKPSSTKKVRGKRTIDPVDTE
jgi:hypothetical protein